MVEKNDVSLETQDSVDVKRNEPQLRFKEFTGELSKKSLYEIAKINPKTPKLPNEFIYIDLESVVNGLLKKINKIKKNDAPSRAQRVLSKGDILFQTVRPYQKNNLFFNLDDDYYVASTGYAQIKSKINAKYLYQYFLTQNFVNEVLKRCTGTSYPAINSEDLKEIKLFIPTLEEQEKIASFLSFIDNKIELLEKTLVLYDKIEKHYIKKIYNNISDGEKISLKNIFNVDSSNLSINSLEENNGKYKLYGAEGVIKTIDFYEKMEPYISIIKDGAGVGRLNLCDAYSSSLGTLQNLVPKENFDINFLYFYLKTLNFQKYIVGSTIPHIYFRDYSKEKLSIPNIEKQKNIGNFFIYFEKRNILLNNKIGCLTNFKKYLLQNMFI